MKRLLTFLVFLLSLGLAPHLANAACSGTVNGTPTTMATLTGTYFADGRPAGSITPDCVRDLAQSALNATFDVLDYGAKCDGATDDTTAIAAANTAVTATTGRLQFPDGTCVTGTITINANVYYAGQGRDTTIVKLKNGANAAVFLGANFGTLTGTNATTGVGGWGISNMTVDGNKANNSGGDGIQVYGYGFDISSVSIRNTSSDGLYTEWSDSGSCPTNGPPDCMESFFSNLLIHDYAGNGWTYKGPHDSQVNRMIIWTFSNASAKGIYITAAPGHNNANAGLTGTTIHVWGANQWSIYLDQTATGVNLTNVELEGATAGQLMNGGGLAQFYNLWTYACTPISVTAQQTTATNLSVTVNGAGYPILPGQMIISGAGTAGTYITAGTPGATGNFTTTSSATTASQAMVISGFGLAYGDINNNGTEGGSNIQMTSTGSQPCGVSWAFGGSNNKLDATFALTSPPVIGSPSYSNLINKWDYITGPNIQSTLSSCGTSPSAFQVTPSYGYIVLGSGSPTACTVTFASGYYFPKNPICTVSANNGTAWGVSAVSTTAVTFTGSATAATLYYQCHP